MGTIFRTSTNESSSGWYLKINPPGNNLKASFAFGHPLPPPRSYKVERKPEAQGYLSNHTRPADVDSTLYERGGGPARPQTKTSLKFVAELTGSMVVRCGHERGLCPHAWSTSETAVGHGCLPSVVRSYPELKPKWLGRTY